MTPEEAQVVSNSQAMGMPQVQRSDRADLIDKLKPEILVETIRQRLMGKELINGKWTSIPALQENALSEAGAWEISNLLLGTTSLNTSLSNLQDHEIKRRIARIAETAQLMCIANHKKYRIKNPAQLRFVNEVVFTNCLVVFKQADGASIQELLKGTTFENRNIIQDVRGSKQGLGGKLLNGLLGGR